MRKQTILFITILSTIYFCNAQIQIGPKAGASLYQVIGGGNDGLKTGLYAGAFVGYSLNKKTIFQIDLAYVEKGTQEDDQEISANYIEVSPKFNFFTNSNDANTGFYIFSGLGFNFLLEDSIQDNYSLLVSNFKMDDFDFSIQLGFGFKMKNNISIDLKVVDFSLTKTTIEYVDNNNNNLGSQFRNVGANLTIAYGFDL